MKKQRNTMQQQGRDYTVLAVFAIILIMVLVGVISSHHPMEYSMYNSSSISYEKGVVNRIVSEDLAEEEGTGRKLGLQVLEVEIKAGTYKGQLVAVQNNLSTTHYVPVKKGQEIIVKIDAPEGTVAYLTVYNYDRTRGILLAGMIFALFMAVVGRRKGFGSVAGLLVSLFFLIKMLIPMLYHGCSPILSSLLTACLIAASCMVLLNGVSVKTGISLISIMTGLVISVGTYYLIAGLLSVTGYQLEEGESLLLISQHTGLNVGQLLFACVVIASLGALMDMTMSLTSSLCEIREVHPKTSRKDLIRSGMHVGGDMVGTMCETLILAFAGTALPFLLVLSSYGIHLDQLLSSNYLAIEILQGITGGISVVLSVPVTVCLTAAWVTRKE